MPVNTSPGPFGRGVASVVVSSEQAPKKSAESPQQRKNRAFIVFGIKLIRGGRESVDVLAFTLVGVFSARGESPFDGDDRDRYFGRLVGAAV